MSDEVLEESNTKINNHLSKFDDVDDFLNEAKNVVQFYFEKQDEFNTLEDFKVHLAEKIHFYVHWFSLSNEERKKLKGEIGLINKNYDELLYLGEFSSVVQECL